MSDTTPRATTPEPTGVSVLGKPVHHRFEWRGPRVPRRRAGKHADEGHNLGVLGGLAALSLDALSSVAYGPEAIALVLVAAGVGALHDIVPITLVITGMLVLLVISYT